MKRITSLKPNEVFVFGSNMAGIHGAGAAKDARLLFGAELGIGYGPTGQCYAIPTKGANLNTLPLGQIEVSIELFKEYAKSHPEKTFIVTPLACGLAGYRPKQIAPMFDGSPDNVVLPDEFLIALHE